jgi:hypothetical protein
VDTPPARTPGSLAESQSAEDYNQSILSFLDERISLAKQQELLRHHQSHAGAVWPVVRLPALSELRRQSPVLLLSVLVYPITQSVQGTDSSVHHELLRKAMYVYGEQIMGRGEISMHLVQALLVTSFWFKTTGWGEQGSCYQLVQIATDMAIDLGIGGPSLMTTPISYMARLDDAESVEARRTWLACFVASAKSSISTRRPNPISWDSHLEGCLLFVESQGDISDLMLGQIARITKIIQDISDELQLCRMGVFVSGNEHATHATMEMLKSRVKAWMAQVPQFPEALRTLLEIWGHFAMVYIHEVVLHTPTNKTSFAAPFIPGRIATKDFPAPGIIIPPLGSALGELIRHCHAVVNTVITIEPAVILSLPFFQFAPTVVYSLYVLDTAFVASTAPGNTHHRVTANKVFGIKACNSKLNSIAVQLRALDPTLSCFTTRMFEAAGWLETWYDDYVAILERLDDRMDVT